MPVITFPHSVCVQPGDDNAAPVRIDGDDVVGVQHRAGQVCRIGQLRDREWVANEDFTEAVTRQVGVCWDPELGRVDVVVRGNGVVVVDATDEDKQALALWESDRADRRAAAARRRRWFYNSDLRLGARAQVVKGRKVPVGTVGEVIWIGDSNWGRRVGLSTGPEKSDVVWTALDNVAPEQWGPVPPDAALFTPVTEVVNSFGPRVIANPVVKDTRAVSFKRSTEDEHQPIVIQRRMRFSNQNV